MVTKYKCGDCGEVPGKLHLDNCDIERCPKCRGQLFSCSCKFLETEDKSHLIDSEGKVYERIKVQSSNEGDFGRLGQVKAYKEDAVKGK